jgi:hypothetical protein
MRHAMLMLLSCLCAPVSMAQSQATVHAAAVPASAPTSRHLSPVGRAMADFTSMLREASLRQAQNATRASAPPGSGAVVASNLQAAATGDAQAQARDNQRVAADVRP